MKNSFKRFGRMPKKSRKDRKHSLKFPLKPTVLPEADESRDLPLHIEAMINEVEQEEDELNQKEQEASISYEEEALALYEKGLSPEEIARQLKSGKTEIELFLKFSGKLKNDS